MNEIRKLQIPLLNEVRRNPYSPGNPTRVLRMLPFYLSRRGSMTHRVRSAAVHIGGWHRTGEGHISLRLWCGQTGSILRKSASRSGGEVTATPNNDFPICGTCEGRAVGAGEEPAAFLIQKHALLFSPRGSRADRTITDARVPL